MSVPKVITSRNKFLVVFVPAGRGHSGILRKIAPGFSTKVASLHQHPFSWPRVSL